MTTKEATQIMRRAFAALTKTEKANLRWHAKKGTRVLCGEMANRYTDGFGGG